MNAAWADVLQLQDQVPERYVVVKGDTLWDISGHFLKQPWRWPEIWQLNRDEIKNPHWIYPGDVIVLDRSGDSPRLKLLRTEKYNGVEKISPRIRGSALDGEAIASISPAAIEPFLKRPLILDPAEFASAPRIAAARDNRVEFSAGDTVYAVNLDAKQGEIWQVFRDGKMVVDPDTKELLGYEIHYLGDVRVDEAADVSTLHILRAKEEIAIGNRLVRTNEKVFINYMPHLPDRAVDGKVVSTYGSVADAASYSTVVINRGEADGLEVGNVLFTYKKGVRIRAEPGEPDRVTPAAKSANLFVYRVFPKLSYGLLLNTTLPVNVGDEVRVRSVEERK